MKRCAYADGGSKQEITEAACKKKCQRNKIDDIPVDEQSSTTPKDELLTRSLMECFVSSNRNSRYRTQVVRPRYEAK